MSSQPYRLLGGPGSPYSLKMRAVLRYRRLNHLWIVPQGYLSSGGELAQANKKIIPVLQLPEDGRYWADSTPMLYALEQRHPGQRSIIPSNPVDAFIAHAIEDFADELLMLAMFLSRWHFPADLEFCPRRQLTGWMGAVPTHEFEPFVARFTKRQIANMNNLIDVAVSQPFFEHLYRELLSAMELQLTESRYLFGTCPSLAEFGLFGQMSQLAIDSTASQIMKATAPRVFQWVQDLDDASGVDGVWRQPGDAPAAGLQRLARLVGQYHLPFLEAHSRAVEADQGRASVTFSDGYRFGGKADPYKANCLLWLKNEFAQLDNAQQKAVQDLLGGAQAVACLAWRDGEAGRVPPHQPL